MTTARILSAGAVALAFMSPALAQQSVTGTITGINRLNSTIAIQRTQAGTVGTNAGGVPTEEFKVPGGLSLEDLHAGDKVSFSVTDTGGTRTVTKIQKQ